MLSALNMDVVRPCLVIEFMTWFERPKVKWKFLHNWKYGGIKIDTRVLYIYIYILAFIKNIYIYIDTTPHLFHKLKFIYTRPTLVWTPHVVAPPFVIWSHLGFNHVFGFPNDNFSCTQWCQYSMKMVWNFPIGSGCLAWQVIVHQRGRNLQLVGRLSS
jgi:hypothetical protein